jgi:hypothetical protein
VQDADVIVHNYRSSLCVCLVVIDLIVESRSEPRSVAHADRELLYRIAFRSRSCCGGLDGRQEFGDHSVDVPSSVPTRPLRPILRVPAGAIFRPSSG